MAELTAEKAKEEKCYELLDGRDELRPFRDRFLIPRGSDGKEVIYLAGNSLGLQPKSVKSRIEQELEDWEKFAVEGHTKAKNPWMPYHEYLTAQTAEIVGALPEEVVNMNSLTANLHFMFVSFYRPEKKKRKILIEGMSFPSDYYAVESQIRFHGLDPAECIVEAKPRSGEHCIRTEDIEEVISAQSDEIALVWLGGVNYYTGQAFEMERITRAAHAKGITVGFDLAHAAGNLRLRLHEWDIDFAVWCNYKYLNGGPGAIGGCYVNKRFHNDKDIPKFLGWWGHDKSTRFLMGHKFEPILTAESWQVSNPPILQLASLKASLDIFAEAGMDRLREKSVAMTSYLQHLIKEELDGRVVIITPEESEERGCQLSLKLSRKGRQIFNKLIERNVICDWREPDVVRVAPAPLYNTFEDVYRFSEILNELVRESGG